MILSQIIEYKRSFVDASRRVVSQETLIRQADSAGIQSLFKKNIARSHHINVIAEIKKASPSKGVIRKDFDPAKIAITYQASGVSGISVLTDEKFFEGRLEYIKTVKNTVSLPVLRKDFIIDEYQVYESAVAGADAVLLICEILTAGELRHLYGLARSLGMDVLVEVHSEEDVSKALSAGADIIGINNRDLHTFKVDIAVTSKLIRMIPQGRVVVSESGIKSYEDLMFLKSLGVHAALIGEVFMEADDIGAKVREIIRH